MSSYDSRIKKVEQAMRTFEDKSSPLIIFPYQSNGRSEAEVMQEIIKFLDITPREFSKWGKFLDGMGDWLITSPNFNFDRWLRENRENLKK